LSGNLSPFPAPLSPFIGREREVADLCRLVTGGAHRLVTVAAPGGMGKTRLALEVASRVSGHFADGIAFASAEACATRDDLAAEVAQAVGYVHANWEDSAAQLFAYLSNKSVLLVLDNLEHIAAEATALIRELLAAPGLTILATSRERLHLSAEAVYPLAGMAHDALDSDALILFEQAAARARPAVPLTDAERCIAAEICAELGGMPLGIVLAASWAETLPIDVLLAEIRAGAGFLSAEYADMPQRHHRLDDLLRVTWARLTADEQAAMARLAIFRGGFTREAAQDAAGTPSGMIKTLMGRSLVWRDPARGRYQLHPLLRQFAAAQNTPLDAADRHAGYYAALLAGLDAPLKGREQAAALVTFSDESENIRAAWAYALGNGQFDRLDSMLEPLALAFNLSNQWHVGESILREACARLADLNVPDALLGRVLTRWVWLALLSGSTITPLPELRRWIERARMIALAAEDASDIVKSSAVAGHLLAEIGDLSGAESLLGEALTVAEAVGMRYEQAEILHLLGYTAAQRGDTGAMLDYSRRSAGLLRASGEELAMNTALINQGSAHMWRGEYAQAQACFDEAMVVGRAHHNWWRELLAEQCLGSLSFHTGDIDAVKESARRVMETSAHYGYQAGVALATHNQIMALLAEGSTIAAWQMLGRDTLLEPVERAYALALCELTLGDVGAARGHLKMVLASDAEKRWPYALGAAAGVCIQHGALEQAVELLSLMAHHSVNTRLYATRIPLYANLRAYLEGKLPPAVFASAWSRGKASTVREMFPRVLSMLDGGPRRAADADALSPREREILGLVAAGHSNQAIAASLVVGVSTVKKHLTHIYAKLGVTSRTQALIKARESGLV
jgi:predicted ATPase/DNA-binding CsgD family transcriptional regulator